MTAGELSTGLEELAGLINFRVGAWQDFGYAEPPTPECTAIPPLGERSAKAITSGHLAIAAIDDLIRDLHALRSQLVTELRTDADKRAERVDAMLAENRARAAARRKDTCGCPIDDGLVRHQRGHCSDPVVAQLGWYFEPAAEA